MKTLHKSKHTKQQKIISLDVLTLLWQAESHCQYEANSHKTHS